MLSILSHGEPMKKPQYPYLTAGDYAIVREADAHSGVMIARIYDADGEVRHYFPIEWTDEQIHHAVRFANKVYDLGYDRGDSDARYQIRSVLGIEPR